MNRKGRPWGRKFPWGRGGEKEAKAKAGGRGRSFLFEDQVEEEEEEGGQHKDPGGHTGEMGSEPGEGMTGTQGRGQFRKKRVSSCEECSQATKQPRQLGTEECLSIVVPDVEARDELVAVMGLETRRGSEESGGK